MIVANNKGISVFDKEGINESPMTGWVWQFKPNTNRIKVVIKQRKRKSSY